MEGNTHVAKLTLYPSAVSKKMIDITVESKAKVRTWDSTCLYLYTKCDALYTKRISILLGSFAAAT